MKKNLIVLMMALIAVLLVVSCAEPTMYTVTFDVDGNKTAVEAQSVEEGAKATAPATKPTSSDKYLTFDCWSADGTTEFKFAETAITSDITLKALWRDYKVGDDGPAGGIIFYDCDADNDETTNDGLTSSVCGWRYLEAGKSDLGNGTTYKLTWGPNTNDVYGTKLGIGEGKSNTNILKGKGIDSFPAAKACVEYNGGGKTDWFLPSKDELNLMYENLAKKNLDSSLSKTYWSSSEGQSNSWVQSLDTGSQTGYSRGVYEYYVRPVRSF